MGVKIWWNGNYFNISLSKVAFLIILLLASSIAMERTLKAYSHTKSMNQKLLGTKQYKNSPFSIGLWEKGPSVRGW